MAPSNSTSETGLSLIEVLVVVFIIGLAAGLVVMSLPDRRTATEAALIDFQTSIQSVQDQAILSGEPIGLLVDDAGYQFQIWRRGQWRSLGDITEFDRRFRLSALDSKKEGMVEDWPTLIFDPTGVNEEVSFEVIADKGAFELTVLPTGGVKIDAR